MRSLQCYPFYALLYYRYYTIQGIDVVMDPLPDDLPDEIMMDEKWLKDDLLCAAGNCIKYSRLQQGVPAMIRVAMVSSSVVDTLSVNTLPITTLPVSSLDPSTNDELISPSIVPMVQFTFIDSGYPLSEERLTNLFNRPEHGDRTQTGGMGLGLYCLSEHIHALQVCQVMLQWW